MNTMRSCEEERTCEAGTTMLEVAKDCASLSERMRNKPWIDKKCCILCTASAEKNARVLFPPGS